MEATLTLPFESLISSYRVNLDGPYGADERKRSFLSTICFVWRSKFGVFDLLNIKKARLYLFALRHGERLGTNVKLLFDVERLSTTQKILEIQETIQSIGPIGIIDVIKDWNVLSGVFMLQQYGALYVYGFAPQRYAQIPDDIYIGPTNLPVAEELQSEEAESDGEFTLDSST
jgi:hypothetical protein